MLNLVQIFFSIVIGIIQAVTVWLPVGGKAFILSQHLLGLNNLQASDFVLILNISTALSGLVYFRKDIISLIKALLGKGTSDEWGLFKYILVTGIVSLVFFLPLLVLRQLSWYNDGLPITFLGIILFIYTFVIWYSKSKYTDDNFRRQLSDIKFGEYVLIGIIQDLCLLPGISLPGVTTIALVLLNVKGKEAFRLSFLPLIILACVAVTSLGELISIDSANLMASIAGPGILGIVITIIIATVVSYLAIDFLMNIAKKAKPIYLIISLGIITFISGLIFVALNGIK